MINGTIKFCRPEDCEKEVIIKDMEMKKFDDSNFSGVEDTIAYYGILEGDSI